MQFSLGTQLFVEDEEKEAVPELLFNLLQGVRDHGNLTVAAKQSGVSYRKAWNLLRYWSNRLDMPLTDAIKGRGATLTELGSRLLWARGYMDSKGLSNMDEALNVIQAELSSVLGDNRVGRLTVCASHCLSLDILENLYQGAISKQISLQLQGSQQSLASLFSGECSLAGFHIAQGELGEGYLSTYERTGDFSLLQIVLSHERQQGLIVAPGNPHRLETIVDLKKGGLRLVNRQEGSGTRLLLDLLLKKTGIRSRDIRGFDDIEQTHTAVCAKIANQRADVALGSQASAAQFGLSFIPLVRENYYFGYRKQDAKTEEIRQFRHLLQSAAWKQAIKQIPGMDAKMAGNLYTQV
ncbi:MAG: helix-turn-helix transcriptional regulator [Acidiferrobacterales bacterium]|nr:helix-turn-helix transcriptional regulator [Acidiferrobacterales bacterium]